MASTSTFDRRVRQGALTQIVGEQLDLVEVEVAHIKRQLPGVLRDPHYPTTLYGDDSPPLSTPLPRSAALLIHIERLAAAAGAVVDGLRALEAEALALANEARRGDA